MPKSVDEKLQSRSRTYTGPFNVIAFDPGGTTGWAGAYYKGTNLSSINDIHVRIGELKGDHHFNLFNMIEQATIFDFGPKPHVVAESFEFRQHIGAERTGIELISCEYLGVIRLACQMFELEYKTQTAAEAKGFVTNAKLKAMGWLVEPQSLHKHENDALRHLVKYLVVDLRIRHPITTSWRSE